MKLRLIGRTALAGAVSVAAIFAVGACGQDNTIDYVYVANAKNNPGRINIYLVDSLSGTLREIKNSPVPAGRNPVAIAATANGKYVYVANHDDNTIIQYGVGTDAKLYPNHTYNTPGNNPTSLTIDSTGTYLFVTDAFQGQYNPTNPGPGALLIYPINQKDGSLSDPLVDPATNQSYFPTCNNPIAVATLNNTGGAALSAVYVVDDPGNQPPKIADTVAASAVGANGTSTIDYSGSTANGCSAKTGQITAFQLAYSGSGAPTINSVTPVAGSPFASGSSPTSIISDTQAHYVYVTDELLNQLLAFTVAPTGALAPISGQFTTGSNPVAVTIDPMTNSFLYVANYGDNSVSTFTIGSGGAPETSASGNFATNTQPVFVYIEPSSGHYLYTANFGDNTITGLHMNSTTGALNVIEHSPFSTNGQPTGMTAVTHGRHVSQILPIY